MAESLDKKAHEWEGLSEYVLNESDFFNLTEGGLEGKYEILKKMNKNQYFVVDSRSTNDFKDIINEFNETIEELKSYGLDIGKGNCEYGYKMPLPEKRDDRRKLIIFKRK